MAHLARGQTISSGDRSTNWVAGSRLNLVFFGVGLVSFLAIEFMHYQLVPDLGRPGERLPAEGVSAVVVGLLTARLVHAANQWREAALLRMQVISEMNHHIRNALSSISLTAESTNNQPCIRVISESVDRIEWTLREVLLRRKPLQEKERDWLWYFHPQDEMRQASGSPNALDASQTLQSQSAIDLLAEDHRQQDV
jgi:hypothetical protein